MSRRAICLVGMLLVALLFRGPGQVYSAPASTPVKGIYTLVALEGGLTTYATSRIESYLANPAVSGIALRVMWRDLEPRIARNGENYTSKRAILLLRVGDNAWFESDTRAAMRAGCSVASDNRHLD